MKNKALREFAAERKEQPSTVATYIRRHPEEFSGHTQMDGKKMLLDEHALELLDKVYPLPKPVEVIPDTESREQLLKAREIIISLQHEMLGMKQQIAEAEATRLLLDDKKQELKDTKTDLQGERERADALFRENAELRAQLEAEKNRKWKFPWSN